MSGDDIDGLIASAFNAYNKKDYDAQWRYAMQALNLDTSSENAATLAFLALWYNQQPDKACSFIMQFAQANSTRGYTLFCVLLAMMHKKTPLEKIRPVARTWLQAFNPPGGRFPHDKLDVSEIRVLSRQDFNGRSETTGQTLEDLYGLPSGVTSQCVTTGQRWRQASYFVVNDISVHPSDWYVFDESAIYIDETLNWPLMFAQNELFRATRQRAWLRRRRTRSLCACRRTQLVLKSPVFCSAQTSTTTIG